MSIRHYHLPGNWSHPSLNRAIAVCLSVLVTLLSTSRAIAEEEPDVIAELNKMRGVQPTGDRDELDRLSKRMDSAWAFLQKNKAQSVPIVTRELRNELRQETPDQFFILDTAYFLISEGDPKGDAQTKELTLDVFNHIDPKARIVQSNYVQLVRLAHAQARYGDPRFLPQLDRIFLDNDVRVEFFNAPHYVRLPAQSVRVLLYGATGPSVEDHLIKRLNEQGYEKYQRIILALLAELGSERSVDAVRQVLETRGDIDHFSMAVTMLMSVGGPKGQEAVITTKTDHLDAKSRDYHQRILTAVKGVTFEQLAEALKEFDQAGRVFNDAELAKRLEVYAQFGVDHEIDPGNLLSSTIPRAELLTQLKRIRSRSLWRLNQHALEETHLTNQIINAVQYKPE